MNAKESRWGANLIIGVVLVALGAIFLLAELLNVSLGRFLWPFFIIIPGLAFFVGMASGGKSTAPLAIPGSIITMVGLILLFQSVTGLWASWAYVWTLIFPVSVGIGLWISGSWMGDESQKRVGRVMAGIGVILFIVFGTFFELVLGISGARGRLVGRIFWPLALIALGLYILLARGGRRPAAQPPSAPPIVDMKPTQTTPLAGPPAEPPVEPPPQNSDIPPAS